MQTLRHVQDDPTFVGIARSQLRLPRAWYVGGTSTSLEGVFFRSLLLSIVVLWACIAAMILIFLISCLLLRRRRAAGGFVLAKKSRFIWSSDVLLDEELGMKTMEEGRKYTARKRHKVRFLSGLDDAFRFTLYCISAGAVNLEPIVDNSSRHQWMECHADESDRSSDAFTYIQEERQGAW